jgi:hypothetical protein
LDPLLRGLKREQVAQFIVTAHRSTSRTLEALPSIPRCRNSAKRFFLKMFFLDWFKGSSAAFLQADVISVDFLSFQFRMPLDVGLVADVFILIFKGRAFFFL